MAQQLSVRIPLINEKLGATTTLTSFHVLAEPSVDFCSDLGYKRFGWCDVDKDILIRVPQNLEEYKHPSRVY